MLDIGTVWKRVQEFIQRIADLEDDGKETKGDVKHLKKEIELMRREMQHDGKIQAYHGQKIGELEQRIKKLETFSELKPVLARVTELISAAIKNPDYAVHRDVLLQRDTYEVEDWPDA